MNEEFLNTLSSVVANATPLVIASIGETITERVGVINLSLDGSMILAAMFGFVAALVTDSLIIGLLAAMLAGALIALIIALASIELRQDQVAVGFVFATALVQWPNAPRRLAHFAPIAVRANEDDPTPNAQQCSRHRAHS